MVACLFKSLADCGGGEGFAPVFAPAGELVGIVIVVEYDEDFAKDNVKSHSAPG